MDTLSVMMLFSSLFMTCLTFDMQLVKVNPKLAIKGVFEVSLGNKYALNASAARDLCEHLALTIASKAQVVEAQKHGLETCRFGWTDEQIAVVPRVQEKPNCGNGRTGVVVWRANPSLLFDAFCFNLTDFEAQASNNTQRPITTHSAVVPTSQAGVHSNQSLTSKPSPSSPLTFRPSSSPSSSHNPSVNFIDDEGKHLPVSSTNIDAIPAALLITVTFAVMLAVFLALYYFKNYRPCRRQCDAEQQKEYIETEVWEHCSKKDLQKAQEEDEEHEEENNSPEINRVEETKISEENDICEENNSDDNTEQD